VAIKVDETPGAESPAISLKPATGFRWTICALIFCAMTANYLDRQLFAILVPFFENDLKLGPTDLALINVSFLVPYGCSMLFVGRWIDRVGIKRGVTGTFLLWNLASIGHALVTSLTGFMGIRLLLGVGESGMYPAAVKTMTDWLPRKERALGNGLVNAGANLGALLAPLLGVWVANHYGWRVCFMFIGGAGIVWIFFWRAMYREPDAHPKVSPSELEYIRSDGEEPQKSVSYSQLFAMRPIYGLGIAKAMTDAPWWFYLTWMPKFLVDQFHLSTSFMAIAIPVIYIVADVGSVGGGWLSSLLIKRGQSVGTARKVAMLACAVMVLPVMTVGLLVDHPSVAGIPAVYWAIAIVSLAAGAHQGWSCNLFTMISDTVPQTSVAVAVGAINGFAMFGASAMQFFVGWSVKTTSSYTLPFVVAGTLYLLALVVIQIFIPHVRLSPTTGRAKISLVVVGAVGILAILGVLQYAANKPTYATLDQYRSQRGQELHAVGPSVEGPGAKVGWMSARWYEWPLPGGKSKEDLVKFDSGGTPFLEAKGSKAARYSGPPIR
jgi:ACS family hexuronate transporter-like MFS transporter